MSFTDHESGLSMGGQFVSTKYRKGGQEFWITVRYIDYNGACLHYDQRVLIIEEFENVRPISLLDVGPLSGGDAKETFKERGREFVRLQGKHFLEYHGDLLKKIHWGELLHLNAVCRVMVDCAAYPEMNQMGQVRQNSDRKGLGDLSRAPDQMLLCAPTVLGYSFTREEWGRFMVDEFSSIIWRNGAFDHLVPQTQQKN